MFYEGTNDNELPLLVSLGNLNKCSKYGVAKNASCNQLIYIETGYSLEVSGLNPLHANNLQILLCFLLYIFVDYIIFYNIYLMGSMLP